MDKEYLGDSYDLVKRFWQGLLSPLAPLFAHQRFIPQALRAPFSLLTNIPIWDATAFSGTAYSLFLDPHTGIPAPGASKEKLSPKHAPISFIADLFEDDKLEFLICYDQSTGAGRAESRESKRDALRSRGIYSFYYVSHAPFLFASKSLECLDNVRQAILNAGIPEATPSGTRVQKLNHGTPGSRQQ